ncbi:dTMP kinase [Candidatus Woesearchaeota archaeon]|nr:dTMP kinase [Candidatus Woesearchaeota archaeon]
MAKLICLEGVIGSGKTTQLQLLYAHLHPDAHFVPELNQFSPLKDAIAEWKKKLTDNTVKFSKEDITNLAHARAVTQQNILSQISPVRYVLFDRSVYTSIVYDAGEVEPEEIEEINRNAGVIFPDKGIILNCPTDEALRRVDKRRREEGNYATRSIHETPEEIDKRRQFYLQIHQQHPELALVDATRTIESVFADVLKVIQ